MFLFRSSKMLADWAKESAGIRKILAVATRSSVSWRPKSSKMLADWAKESAGIRKILAVATRSSVSWRPK
ncbi:hypothetical protein RO3G_14531 [Rhizopus delemar RA 99-880]|uniref:Uncharacterized protein n=1 Tax=Rhizopus delemar (strain RA 99-880 / ATCC MYA-4621 / FGSC 9543 / NRRL 43880) TaxID=246409 RepID=I1CMZ0_RHIO9|nr:hypothetical protein RO3G_14531 [Rhizopus delemar RA 99-880]|eukprot:EIE89820.1 hypothetical protein RO3G_14531 [Rhizopus delemar RA 99-880]